jgi:hypothetical protein
MQGAVWDFKRIAIFSAPLVLILLGLLAWIFLRKTLRTRKRMEKQLREDPDINEWLVVFNWSRKALYGPAILVSALAAVLMIFFEPGSTASQIIGGVWLGVFFLNFLVDEYEMSVKILLICLLCLLLLFVWLTFLDWLPSVLRFFRRLDVTITTVGYFTITLIFLLAVVVSWVRGLFYYVAITPNYLNIQTGPTETGEQVAREEYSTRIDTGDFLERLLGFGRLVITFSDQRRQPMVLLISHIGRRARVLESIRGKLAMDYHQAAREGGRVPDLYEGSSSEK